MQIITYQPHLKAFAKKLRREMTLAEVLLWNRLKRRQVLGYDFDRQRPVGKYIVDFYCKELRLGLEVDGRSHDVKEQADLFRQDELRKAGVELLRFWDAEIKRDMQSVLTRLKMGIGRRESELGVAPHVEEPTPPCGHPSKAGNPEHPC